MQFYRNNGTATAPVFAADAAGNPLAGFDVGYFSVPSFVDIDNDGDFDAFVGESNGTVKFYRNNGTATVPVFAADAANNPLAGFNVGYYAAPAFADIDNDGDLDAFVGEYYGTVKFYRNNGTATVPVFAADAAGNPLAGFDVVWNAAPSFVDIDNDGDLDAFVGEWLGQVSFFENFENPVPAAPSSLRAVAVNSRTVRMRWKDNSGNEAGFHVFRRIGKGGRSLIATLAPNTTVFTDRRLRSNRTYSYWVESFNVNGGSTQVRSSVRVLGQPQSLRARVVGGKVKLVWKDRSKGEKGFIIQRRKGKGRYVRIGRARPNARSFTDRRVKGGSVYTYRIRAVGSRSLSSWSNRAKARP